MTLNSIAGAALVDDTIPTNRPENLGLLKTKLCVPPLHPTLVPRGRLIAKLDDGLYSGRPLTLVSAPAGAGKTTLLSAWLRQPSELPAVDRDSVSYSAPIGAAWLALDQEDNEPTRFWTYLLAALQTIDGGLGRSALPLLAAPQRLPTRKILSTLLNDLAAYRHPVAVVLDDYQIITASAIHKGITFIADHAPPQLHIVLSSRADPPLPLGRFRARDQLTELRAAELNFTLAETATFLATITGVSWRAEDVRALHARSEGWIAALHVAGMELRRLLAVLPAAQVEREIARFVFDFAGNHHDIQDFIEQEVLKHQPEHVQTFLMLTSPLQRLNGSLCDAVIGRSGSQELLKQLERANMFLVPLDGVRYWYRYHALFADVLQSRLWQTHPELAPLLYRRAAEWCSDHGYTAEAIDYRLRAEHNDLTTPPVNQLERAAIGPAWPGRDIERESRSADDAIDGAQASALRLVDQQAALPPAVWIADDHLLGEQRSQLTLPAAQRLTPVQLVEQLTTRELEILHLMVEGLTYLQMSHRLVLGLNTVRFHVKNIYGKLNVHQRFQALARARELHLLPEQGPHHGA